MAKGLISAAGGLSAADKKTAGEWMVEGHEILRGRVAGSIPARGAATITPGTSDQTIPAGLYLSGEQTIRGDAGLIPENIRGGANIFGVTGTYVPTYGRFKINISGSSTVSADAFAATCARWQIIGGSETDAIIFTFLKSCYVIRETLTRLNAGNTMRFDLRIGTYYLPVFELWI